MKRIIIALAVYFSVSSCGHAANDTGTLLLLLTPRIHSTTWGSSPPGAQDRPDHIWLNQFATAQTYPLTDPDTPETLCLQPGPCVLTIDQLQLSDTMYISRPHTKLFGKPGNKITFANNSGGSFIELETGIHDVVLENLNIDGEGHNYRSNSIFGIMVNGENIEKIAIKNNHIHHLHSNNDAHAVAVYGTGDTESNAVRNVIVDQNTVDHMRTGSSESIAINGNVKNWEVTNNTISHVNNIAIDAIGGEGTSKPVTVSGRTLPGAFDAARYGFIENNTVTDMSTLTNPSYGSEHSWAGGIYVDGGHHLLISGNNVTGSEWAYDIGAENCVKPRHILLQNNTASSSYYGDFYIGGYAPKGFEEDPTIECDPRKSIDDNEGHGYVYNVTVKNNSFTTPSTSPHFVHTIELGNRIRKTLIIHTGVVPQHADGVVTGDENSIRIRE